MSCVLHRLSIFKDVQTVVILVNRFAQNNFVEFYGNVLLIPFVSGIWISQRVRASVIPRSAMSVLTEQQMSLIAQDFQLDLI